MDGQRPDGRMDDHDRPWLAFIFDPLILNVCSVSAVTWSTSKSQRKRTNRSGVI